MLLLKLFSRKWLLTTFLVLIGTIVLIRLGVWQLDRLAQRRAFNAQLMSARSQSVLDLNQEQPDTIMEMEWRSATVSGEYDFKNQMAIRNQYYDNEYGYHLLTPLLFDRKAVLVDRGWIPADGNSTPADWRKYDQAGSVKVLGQIRLGQVKPAFGGVTDTLPGDGSRLEIWNNADVARIAGQLPYPILPVYIQENIDPSGTQPPIPYQPEVDLTEGPHFGYAMQWFAFAAILFFGYPFYLRKQETHQK